MGLKIAVNVISKFGRGATHGVIRHAIIKFLDVPRFGQFTRCRCETVIARQWLERNLVLCDSTISPAGATVKVPVHPVEKAGGATCHNTNQTFIHYLSVDHCDLLGKHVVKNQEHHEFICLQLSIKVILYLGLPMNLMHRDGARLRGRVLERLTIAMPS